jgi:hypothetical protein
MYLPKTEQEFNQMPQKKHTHCIKCGAGFSSINTYSPLGWRETQISGWCESCFDEEFPEEPEEGEDE